MPPKQKNSSFFASNLSIISIISNAIRIKKQKNTENESESSSVFSIASQDSDQNSSTFDFKKQDMVAMRMNFQQVPSINAVIPNITGISFIFVLAILSVDKSDFNVRNLEETDGHVLTFIVKLHEIIENPAEYNNSLADDLLRIVSLNSWPLKIQNNLPCRLYIKDELYTSVKLGFVIKMRENNVILVAEDSYLKNIGYDTNFGETQIAIEILACGYENIHFHGDVPTDQTLWVIRIISTYVTFYKATISAAYWQELADGLPKKQSVEIKRWPAKNDLTSGFDLAEPNGRRLVLTALVKLRESLLQNQNL